jgi:hypothetical protein
MQERLNESFISLITIMLVGFTDFCPDPKAKYYLAGWLFISIFSLCILFNLGLLIKESLKYLNLLMVKYYRRIKRWYDNKYG